MKKVILVLVLCLLTLSFTSCVDNDDYINCYDEIEAIYAKYATLMAPYLIQPISPEDWYQLDLLAKSQKLEITSLGCGR